MIYFELLHIWKCLKKKEQNFCSWFLRLFRHLRHRVIEKWSPFIAVVWRLYWEYPQKYPDGTVYSYISKQEESLQLEDGQTHHPKWWFCRFKASTLRPRLSLILLFHIVSGIPQTIPRFSDLLGFSIWDSACSCNSWLRFITAKGYR